MVSRNSLAAMRAAAAKSSSWPVGLHPVRCWGGAFGLLAATLGGHWLWPLLHRGVMLLLSGSTLALLVALRGAPSPLPHALRWLCSWGRLSYEIYLSPMFVGFIIMRLYRFSGD